MEYYAAIERKGSLLRGVELERQDKDVFLHSLEVN